MQEVVLEEMATQVDIEYYDLKGKELHLLLPPGDLVKICNVLHDYTDLLRYFADEKEDNIENAVTVHTYRIYADRLKKIQSEIEDTIGYNVEKAIEKCKKKAMRNSSDKDIGEDALVLAARSRATKATGEEKKEEEPKKASKPKKEVNEQISIFDMFG